MEFFIKAVGVKESLARTERIAAAAVDAEPAFITIRDLIFKIEESMFDSQGHRGGGSWRQLTEAWLTRKVRLGLDPRINHATLALRDSVTKLGAEGQRVHLTQNSLILTTDLPQAGPSQKYRPFVRFTKYDRTEMRAVMRDHLARAWRTA